MEFKFKNSTCIHTVSEGEKKLKYKYGAHLQV